MLDYRRIEQYRENNRIEAKKAAGGLPRSIWETYSAFANTVGGVILLGVEELPDHSLRPIHLPHAEQMVSEFWNTINNPNQVSVNILSEKHVVIHEQDGCRFISITVPRAQRYDKPVYIDRKKEQITLSNPGSFRIPPEEAQSGGLSDPRNTALMKMFNLINIGERAGSGIPSIYSVWRRQGWPEPTLAEELSPERATLTLPLIATKKAAIKSSGKEVTVKYGGKITAYHKQQIIEYLTEHIADTSTELAGLLGLKSTRIKELLSELQKEDLVVAEGAFRNRTYKLKA